MIVRSGPRHAGGTSQIGAGHGINGESVTLKDLAAALTFNSDRTVMNETGIEDMFDIHLPPFLRGAPTPGSTVDGVPVDINAPSMAWRDALVVKPKTLIRWHRQGFRLF